MHDRTWFRRAVAAASLFGLLLGGVACQDEGVGENDNGGIIEEDGGGGGENGGIGGE